MPPPGDSLTQDIQPAAGDFVVLWNGHQTSRQAEALAETIRHNKEMEALGLGQLRQAIAKSAASSTSAFQEKVRKISNEIGDTVKSVHDDVESKKMDAEQGKQRLKLKLVEQLPNVTPEQADQFLSKPGVFWGTNPKSTEEIYAGLAPVVASMLTMEGIRKKAHEGKVAVINAKTGETGQVAAARIGELREPWTVVP